MGERVKTARIMDVEEMAAMAEAVLGPAVRFQHLRHAYVKTNGLAMEISGAQSTLMFLL